MKHTENRVIRPPNLAFSGLDAFFTTKDMDDRFFERYTKLFLPVQRHTDRVYVLDDTEDDNVVADAVITRKRGLLIGVQVADCIPILLYDRKENVIGAVHTGWRGTAKGILRNSINLICEAFGSLAENIIIAMGPSIRGCCYEVGHEVIKAVERVTGGGEYYRSLDGRLYLDLSHANMIQALSTGIAQDNIWQSKECTSCNPDRFYSYRYSGGKTGRQGGFIGMW